MDASLKKSCKSFSLIGSIQTNIHPLEKQTQKNLTHKMSIIRGFEMIKIETASHAIASHKKSFHRLIKKWPKMYST